MFGPCERDVKNHVHPFLSQLFSFRLNPSFIPLEIYGKHHMYLFLTNYKSQPGSFKILRVGEKGLHSKPHSVPKIHAEYSFYLGA